MKMRRRTYSGAYNENMLEVHAILQRQRCNENITETTGTLSNAYKNTELNLNSVFPFYTKYFIVPLFSNTLLIYTIRWIIPNHSYTFSA